MAKLGLDTTELIFCIVIAVLYTFFLFEIDQSNKWI